MFVTNHLLPLFMLKLPGPVKNNFWVMALHQ